MKITILRKRKKANQNKLAKNQKSSRNPSTQKILHFTEKQQKGKENRITAKHDIDSSRQSNENSVLSEYSNRVAHKIIIFRGINLHSKFVEKNDIIVCQRSFSGQHKKNFLSLKLHTKMKMKAKFIYPHFHPPKKNTIFVYTIIC